MPTTTRKLMLVDGNSLVYRSFFAMPRLTNRAGLPTNAVYGFATVLRKLLNEEEPELAAVVFDAGGKTFRHELFSDYKANRPPTPDDLTRQMPYTRKLCQALGLPIIETPGIEADDLIGTLALRAVEGGFQVFIVSSDKDFLQLVTDRILVIHPGKYDRYDPEAVRGKLGVPPERVIDLLALMGDSIDNVPGVPGIGEKGAAKLVAEWGPLEEILEHAEEVKNKRQREGLEDNREQALLSKKLVTIATDMEVDLDWEALEYRGADRSAAFSLFDELGFTTLLKDYAPEASSVTEMELRRLRSATELGAFLVEAKAAGRLALWLELEVSSKRFDPWSASIAGLGLAHRAGEGVFIQSSESFPPDRLTESLEPVLADAAIDKTAHDLKTALLFFGARGIEVQGLGFDCRVASYVLNPSRRSQELHDLSLEFLQKGLTEPEESSGAQALLPGMAGMAPGATGGGEAGDRGRLYAERAERLLSLRERMERRLAEEELEPLFRDIEMPLIEVLASMELAGIAIDRREFDELSRELAVQLERLEAECHELAGVEFNLNSPKQVGEILFDKMNLPSFKKTQTKRQASTSMAVLEELAVSFPLPRKILDWRSLAKLKGTYVDALPALVQPQTGRIHTSFNQTVAATGRLSSSDPNLQNIPIRTDLGRRLRAAFVAPEGARLLSADYSQIELRVLAHMSGDESLIAAFQRGEDIHDRTARQVFDEDSHLSEAEKRRRAKIINFSIIYGKTAFTLGKEFGVPTREAQAFIDAYLDRYPKVRSLIEQIIRDARRTGKVRTLFGRHRYVPEIGARNRNTRAAAERMAVNTPIQGTAADLIKKAMVDLARRLRAESLESRLLLQVHDELVLEVPEEELERASSLVRETMEGVYPLAVPLKVDLQVGKSWKH